MYSSRNVTKRGWEVISPSRRGFYNAINILKTGTCPDHRPSIYARSSEIVNVGGFDYQAAIGSFLPGQGMDVFNSFFGPYEEIGVVSGIFAEFLNP